MKYFNWIIILFLSVTLLIGCKYELKEDFEIQLKNKPKLFLKYWVGMSKKDFERVSDTLNKDGVLDYYRNYKTITCGSLRIVPVYEWNSNSLKSIELIGNECLYKLYQNKYGLPDLITHIYNETPKIQTYNGIYDSGYDRYQDVSQEDPIVIEKGDNVIIIEMEYYKKCREENPYKPVYPYINSSLGDFIFTYKLKNTYLKEEKERLKTIEKLEIGRKNKKREEEERKEKVGNEI